MTNTKENVMPLYLGRCKVSIAGEKSERLLGVKLFGDKDDEVWFKIYTDGTESKSFYASDDCQLILKRLSSMSEGEKRELSEIKPTSITGDPVYISDLPLSITLFADRILWLITNGYALDDSWFDGENPIAVESEQK